MIHHDNMQRDNAHKVNMIKSTFGTMLQFSYGT